MEEGKLPVGSGYRKLLIDYRVSPSRFALVQKIISPLDQNFRDILTPGQGYSQGNSHLEGTVPQGKPRTFHQGAQPLRNV
jgi:hypothetical protein